MRDRQRLLVIVVVHQLRLLIVVCSASVRLQRHLHHALQKESFRFSSGNPQNADVCWCQSVAAQVVAPRELRSYFASP